MLYVRWRSGLAGLIILILPLSLLGQETKPDSVLQVATLENVVSYAITHQPLIQQSLVDQEITESTIKTKLADWYPQINFNYNLVHNFEIQPNYFQGNITRFGIGNTSLAQFALTQNIFNRDVLLASKTASEVRIQSLQKTSSSKIDVAVNVTKAFYDVLATSQQIKLGKGDIVRLGQSLKTAKDQYSAGITDKTDFKRATIALNNTQATLKSNMELLKYKMQNLKVLMGYTYADDFEIVYDTLQMENEIDLDTLQTLDYTNRIDYKLLTTQQKLQNFNLKYSKWSFLPTVALSGAYNFYYLSPEFSLNEIYKTNTPYSNAILTIGVPIFQGGKRTANIKIQKWNAKRLDWDLTNLKNNSNAEYIRAMASYKSSLATYMSLRENVVLAKEVYDIIQLQYKTGIKTYLEVITAETDLRNARINYFNSLYQVLASKIDVQKSLGQINY
ncbi:MAG: TolC family protein [Cyclobacteriaceae bacterium]|nr:TolC family protein [Cyclobacteriaceae bacterium]